MCFSVSGHAGRMCGDRRWLCMVRELAGDPTRSTCPRVALLLTALCRLVGLALTPLLCSFSSLPSHPSPKTYITCQIHSVITRLIKALHSKATGSLWGCGICMTDIHTCKCTHTHARTHSVMSDIVPGCCGKSPRGTNNQMITSSDGWSHLTSASPF